MPLPNVFLASFKGLKLAFFTIAFAYGLFALTLTVIHLATTPMAVDWFNISDNFVMKLKNIEHSVTQLTEIKDGNSH
ncbi:MAG: hypothetical protein ACKUBY_05380 [Candidatus Moraniibacteriota bacterium]|jgi:hypothetical protein